MLRYLSAILVITGFVVIVFAANAANVVTVLSGGPDSSVQEHYRDLDQDHFVYSLDISRDGGANWDMALIEVTLERVE